MAKKPKTRIHGVAVEDYITGRTEDGALEMDLTALGDAINNSATCATLNCDAGVAGRGICQSCFMAQILGNVRWEPERAGWIRTDIEEVEDAEG